MCDGACFFGVVGVVLAFMLAAVLFGAWLDFQDYMRTLEDERDDHRV